MAASRPILLLLVLTALASTISAHNITAILSGFPEYSVYNSYLSQTKLADDINSRQTITVLVLNNGAMSSVTSNHPLSVIKRVLSLHVLLDYFDGAKLHQVPNGTTLSTTLYQTTGSADGNAGFVNITDLKGGKVGLGSAASGSKLDSSYTKSVKQIPYNISVLEISSAIIAPGLLTAPAPLSSDVNITALLEKAGCKTFASLINANGVIKTYESAIDKGLTIFAPSDEAFKAKGVPDLSKLSNGDIVSLLLYHARGIYTPIGTLKATNDPLTTLATNGAKKYQLTATRAGDEVTLHTGAGTSRISDTVLDATPLAIFTVDSVLLPSELFGKSPSPAPSAEPAASPSPSSLAPSPAVGAPSPSKASPPAPLADTPGVSPAADAPSHESQNSTSDNGAGHVKGSAVLAILVTVSATVLSSLVLS